MSMIVTVKITGTKETKARLNRLGSSLNNFSSAFRTIGDRVTAYYANQGFASQGGVFGDRWARLNPNYAAAKAKRYPGRQVLVATGKMQGSFKASASAQSVTIRNTDPKFVYHQSSAPRSKMPRRVMMGVNQPVHQIVKQEIEQELRKKIRNA